MKIDNNEQILQIDFEEDIILPDTYWGEFFYIYCCLKEILRNLHKKQKRKILMRNLIRQIKIHRRWMHVR